MIERGEGTRRPRTEGAAVALARVRRRAVAPAREVCCWPRRLVATASEFAVGQNPPTARTRGLPAASLHMPPRGRSTPAETVSAHGSRAARDSLAKACPAAAPRRLSLDPPMCAGCAPVWARPAAPRDHASRWIQTQSGGSSSAPRNSTSWRNSTPNVSCARRRASAISEIASAVVAPSAFSMKLACLGEIRAPPIR